jgi:hypothetical protein
MRKRFASGSGLLLAAALLAASPSAGAATPRHKPAKAAPRKKPPKDAPADSDADKPSATPDPEKGASTPSPGPAADKPALDADKPTPAPKPSSAPDQAPPDAPKDASATAHEPAANPAAGDEAPATKLDEPAVSASDAEALGRREAARISAGRIAVAIALSGGVANRHFTYSDPVGRALAPYRLPVAPIVSLELEAYPGASTDVPVLRDLGLRGRLSRGFAFDSNTPQGIELTTSWTRFGGELRERTLLPGPHAFELGILAGLDASYFGITSKQPVPALLPSARTVALRFGFDAQIRVAWLLSLRLGGAYLVTTTPGEIYDHFRRPKVGGVDGDFAALLDVSPGFQAVLSGRYTRYFASFKPRLGDRYVAGGALDQQMQFGLGVRYAH